ncbi:ATP-binding protein [Streptomyces bacillaris]|uniref:ATP-binding protein n=1 Tax=Streptomyces bacillaris TaxID=68179 RepID=UPI00346154DE
MVETGAGPLPAYTETLPRSAEPARLARRLVRLALDKWGLDGVKDAAELVVSELLTNAVRHARRSSVRVTVTRLGEELVRVSVVDLSKERPAARVADADQESGQGLEIVEALSGGRWGVDPLPWGKRVWPRSARRAIRMSERTQQLLYMASLAVLLAALYLGITNS